jgi:serine/threonine protein kinase
MAQVIPIGQPENDAEREAIAYLRDRLPADYRIIHNFELRGDNGQWFEVDVAVVAPHAMYLVDVKSTGGEIHVAGGKWHPEGRVPFASPLGKLTKHVHSLRGVLSPVATGAHAALRYVWVEPVVLLTAARVELRDPKGYDREHSVRLRDAAQFFTDTTRFQNRSPQPASTVPHIGEILKTFTGKGRAPQGLPLLGRSWRCEERLTGNDFYTEFRARNEHAAGAERVIVRLYHADPYLPEAERALQKERIANAYTALCRLRHHPAIPKQRDFFPTERDDGYVLVLDDAPGNSMRFHLENQQHALTMDQKLRITRDLLSALAHCHAAGVLHRAVSPATVVVGLDGQARLVDFDFARPGPPRDHTLPEEYFARLETSYLAPELKENLLNCSAASDVYAAGATLYELFTGKPTFENLDAAIATTQVFPEKISSLVSGLPEGFDAWLEKLCAFNAAERPSAADALPDFDALFDPPNPNPSSSPEPEPAPVAVVLDYNNLPVGETLAGRYIVECALGKGGFGRVYKVIDTLCDAAGALKIIVTERGSPVEWMKQEFRTLRNLPPHPSVVGILHGGMLDGDSTPYLLMEYIDGANVAELAKDKRLSVSDARQLGVQAAEGLAHLHANQVTHGDIKPDNLMWTNKAVKIIDFNVARRAGDYFARGGGTRKFLPPDLDLTGPLTPTEQTERDIYALGVTLYEAVTGEYPWPKADQPPPDQPGRDPREIPDFEDLSQGFVEVLLKAIAPRRAERYASAIDLAQALRAVAMLRTPNAARVRRITTQSMEALGAARPNTNPFVFYLLTLYSQSRRTNAGTRGLDAWGRRIYVDTALDLALQPATLDGQFRLVLISGNAGDGKTAFIQQVEGEARRRGANVQPYGTGNGTTFELNGRAFRTNYDGSQDEGDKINDDVLRQFFAPFAGTDSAAWPTNETRLIAINEGRLIDFFDKFAADFPHLKQLVNRGLRSGEPEEDIAIVNLNLRSVVAETEGAPSIFERLIKRLAEPQFWQPCKSCDLREKCYVHHNAQTFANPTTGAQVIERLKLLYRLATLRAKLHITMRDLRSALAFMLVGTHDCDEIHELYDRGGRDEIAKGFYFNSWAGIGGDKRDRLLRLLRDVDVGQTSEPKLDRSFDFHPPDPAPALMDFEPRGRYDRDLLLAFYSEMQGDFASRNNRARFRRHRDYVGMLRRRHFFESRDDSWRNLIPYSAASAMLTLLATQPDPREAAKKTIRAINRGEGLLDNWRLRGKLALQVRQVESATVRSYRVFPAEKFELLPHDPAAQSPYLEHAPSGLILRYADDTGLRAELVITLDVFEMLERLNKGYRPTVDEEQGYKLSLAVFKNIVLSAPYQEVLLTPTGHDFYSVSRERDGSLTMRVCEEPPDHAA